MSRLAFPPIGKKADPPHRVRLADVSVSSAVFISKLRGIPMLDARGEQVGKVRDVVVQARIAKNPRVRGLVVELFARRQIFVPMIRVRSIDVTQIVIGGQVDTRRFERRSSEVLVMDDLFDRFIERKTPDGKLERALVHDIAMAAVRNKDWALTEVALREVKSRRFGIPQYGQIITREWIDVAKYVWTDQQYTHSKIAEFSEMHPADVARELHDMDPDRRSEIALALDDELLADAFQELPNDEQVELLESLEAERAADVLEEMDPDDAADLINDLPDEMAEDLLARMQPEDAQDVRNLLQYEELTAGGMMTPEPVIVSADSTIATCLAKVRNADLTPALASMVFITRPPQDPPTGKYIGAVHIQRLLREPPSLMAGRMVDDEINPVSPDLNLYDLSRYFATYNLVIAPVVDENQQLVGAVTVDDLLDHMLPLDWRGIQMDGEDVDEQEEVTNE